jgi:Fe-S-cluster-containing hydrogenase component 2/thioredoxin reductase/CRP-like cAMP-binding protein
VGAAPPRQILPDGCAAPPTTIQQYQKGKHVMAEPGYLELRSDIPFAAGTRESILGAWQDAIERLGVNVRFGAEVTAIRPADGTFAIDLARGEGVTADRIVLAIGMAGNPRKLGAPGENLERVQYQLDDPDEYHDEVIFVIGAGDAAIENALGLARHNQVHIVNRRDEFSRAKDGNLNAVLAAITDPNTSLDCFYNTSIRHVVETPDGPKPISIALETPQGQVEVACDRVIARLGGVPPRAFVESVGIVFPNQRPDAVPELSRTYETNIPGVYIIGSLAGYPLIKQAMNQGFEVVEYIRGNPVKPADHRLLEYQFRLLPFEREVDDLLELFQRRIPMFAELNTLAFRELVIESEVLVSYPDGELLDEANERAARMEQELAELTLRPRSSRLIREGDAIYRANDYSTSFFTILEGEVVIESPGYPDRTLARGEFFGEDSLISGRPRRETARAGANCILVETPRRIIVKLMNSSESIRAGIDWIFVVRELQRGFAPLASFEDLRQISLETEVCRYRAGELIYEQGAAADCMHLVRSGSVSLTRETADGAMVLAEVRAGSLVGQFGLMGDSVRREQAVAAVATETIRVDHAQFHRLLGQKGARIEALQDQATRQAVDVTAMEVRPESAALMRFLMGEGLGEATDTLIIDEHLCIGCDNCEKACAETHGGVSRLDRKAGATFANVHVPIACRHCEHPHCMKDCPPNAIKRSIDGQVFIDATCIGCGNCESNCPYDAIRMEYPAPAKPGLFAWMLFGRGPGPGEARATHAAGDAKRAMKCDACKDQAGGPACVSSCPTGAAQRIGPTEFIRLAR